MDFVEMLRSLIPLVGQQGATALAAEFTRLAGSANEPWKKAVLTLLGEAVAKHGIQGLTLVETTIENLATDKPVHLDFSNLEMASVLLAQMENAEADRRSQVRDYLNVAFQSVGTILQALIKGLAGVPSA